MTNENKTVAELLNDVDADAIVRDGVLYYEQTIERVFGTVLAVLNEHIAALNALLVQQEREIVFSGKQKAELENVLLRKGFVRCDTSACNCGSWHHRYGLPERMAELKDALAEAGFSLCNENGHLVSKALSQLIAEYVRLQEQNTNLSRAVAELTETKADFYRSGVADGRAQKEYELDELRAAVEHRESQGLGLYVHSEPDTLLQVAHRMACKLHPEKSHLEIANELAKHNHQQPSVNEELFVVAQQHPSRPEVSMFTANAKVAEEYKRIGWTVLKIQRAEAAKKESGK